MSTRKPPLGEFSNKVTKVDIDLPVKDLDVDPRVQRAYVRLDRVERIKSEFNPLAIGRIHVSLRKDRSWKVLDGWHRLLAVRELTDNQGEIPCTVYEHLSLEEEAHLFLWLNSGERPTVIDRYNVSLVAGDETTLAIDQILHSLGWKVAPTGGQGQLSCVKTIQALYQRSEQEEEDPNLLFMALKTINASWGTATDAAQAHIVMGLGRFWGEYRDKINYDRLVNALQKIGNPMDLTITSKQLATLQKRKLAMAVAAVVVDNYNRGLSAGSRSALPQWSKRA